MNVKNILAVISAVVGFLAASPAWAAPKTDRTNLFETLDDKFSIDGIMTYSQLLLKFCQHENCSILGEVSGLQIERPWHIQPMSFNSAFSLIAKTALIDKYRLERTNKYIRMVPIDTSNQKTDIEEIYAYDSCANQVYSTNYKRFKLDSLQRLKACPVPLIDSLKPIRELYVRVSGLSKSSAKKLGVQWNDLIATFSNDRFDRLYSAALVASDSVGQLNFARSLTFAVRDSGSLTFGSEYRRPASVINSENGSSVTAYESIFDGLSVDIINDAYKLTYRQSNSVLTVPSFVGFCSVGIADISSVVLQTVPYLSSIPYVGDLFTFRQNTSDQLAISVCVEPK